jgi:hypothetical protein
MKLFVDIDSSGNITDVLSGKSVIPMKTYHHEFDVDEVITNELYKYQVINGTLVARDTLPDVGENIQIITQEQEMEQLKKDNEMNALAIMELAELLMGGGA